MHTRTPAHPHPQTDTHRCCEKRTPPSGLRLTEKIVPTLSCADSAVLRKHTPANLLSHLGSTHVKAQAVWCLWRPIMTSSSVSAWQWGRGGGEGLTLQHSRPAPTSQKPAAEPLRIGTGQDTGTCAFERPNLECIINDFPVRGTKRPWTDTGPGRHAPAVSRAWAWPSMARCQGVLSLCTCRVCLCWWWPRMGSGMHPEVAEVAARVVDAPVDDEVAVPG